KDKVPNHKPDGNDNEEVCDLLFLFKIIRYVDKSYMKIALSFIFLKQNLEFALELFKKSQTYALTKLYKQKDSKKLF
ncbi:17483_t:CDS:2, partial [Gigaspora margarita]